MAEQTAVALRELDRETLGLLRIGPKKNHYFRCRFVINVSSLENTNLPNMFLFDTCSTVNIGGGGGRGAAP